MKGIGYIFIFCFPFFVLSQNKKLDSLLLEEKKNSHDTIKAMVFFHIANMYSKAGNIERSTGYFVKAKKITQHNYKKIFVRILRFESSSLKRQNKFQEAIDTLRKAISIASENKLEKELGLAYGDIGVVYRMVGNFKFSIENLLRSIPLREKIGVKADIMNGYNSLANSYSALAERTKNVKDLEKSIEYYKKAETFTDGKPELNAMIYTNLGVTNGYIGKIKKDSNYAGISRNYHLKSYEIQSQLHDSVAIIQILGNIGVINFDLGNQYNDLTYLNSAEKYFLAAIKLEKILKIEHLYGNRSNLGALYLLNSKYTNSKETRDKGIKLCEEVYAEAVKANDFITQINMLEDLMSGYDISGDYKMAYNCSKKLMSTKDTIFNSENNNAIQELSAKFETDKKQKENEILKQQGELNATQLEQQKIVSYSLILGVIVLVVLAIMIYKNLSLSKKTNAIISKQKEEVEKQKHLVEEKQKEILDSINYAKRIQQAALPSEKYIERNLPKK